MKLTRKNIVFGIVFFLGILLNYSGNFHFSESIFFVEVTTDNNANHGSCFSDSDIHEQDQSCRQFDLLTFNSNQIQKLRVGKISGLSVGFCTIWQPPQLS